VLEIKARLTANSMPGNFQSGVILSVILPPMFSFLEMLKIILLNYDSIPEDLEGFDMLNEEIEYSY
jgi:hypothetical protein